MHFLGQSLALSLILAISTLSRMGESVCSDHPRLFLHQKTSVRELLESDSFVTLTDISREFLTCRGSQNVDWIYEGNGVRLLDIWIKKFISSAYQHYLFIYLSIHKFQEPSKIQESSSIQIKTDHENDTSYCMTSRISIYPKQSDTDLAKHTGKYTCHEIGNISNSVSIYVFVGSESHNKTVQIIFQIFCSMPFYHFV